MHDGTECDTRKTVDLLRIIAERRHEPAGAVLIPVEELNVLAEDCAEAELAELGGERRGRSGKEVVLHADRDHGEDGDNEEPERVAVVLVAHLVVVRKGEASDALRKDDTERRVHRTGANRSCEAERVVLPALAVDDSHAAEELVQAQIFLVLLALLLLLLLDELAREGPAGVGAAERNLLGGLLLDVLHLAIRGRA